MIITCMKTEITDNVSKKYIKEEGDPFISTGDVKVDFRRGNRLSM